MGKNVFLYLLFIVAGVFGLCGCMSDLSEDPVRVSKGEEVSIKVSMPEFKVETEGKKGSRVVYTDNELSLKWESNDKLAIVGYNGSKFIGTSVLSLTSSNNSDAVFKGNTVAGATAYDVYYPASAVDASGNVNINYSGQSQNGNGSTAHLKNVILLKQTEDRLMADRLLLKEKDIPMQMQNSIIKFELSNLFITKPVSLKWEIEDVGGNKTDRTLGINNVDISKDNKFVGYLCFPSMSINAKSITVSLKNQTDGSALNSPMNYHIDVNKEKTYLPNYRYTAAIKDNWIYRVYYKSNMNINESFSATALEGSFYNKDTQEGYLDFKQENVSLKNLRLVGLKKEITSLDIYGISGIDKYAFKNCPNIEQVILHEGVDEIGIFAFKGCKKLNKITLPEGIHTIGQNAFDGCEALNNITIPESVTNIGNDAFANCTGLETVVIPNQVKSIEKNTFQGCKALKSVQLGTGVETIAQNAFDGCVALNNVTIPSQVKSIGKYTFKNCNKLTVLTVQSTTPPTLDNSIKDPLGVVKTISKIYVPASSVDAYKAAEGWSKYAEYINPIP